MSDHDINANEVTNILAKLLLKFNFQKLILKLN